MIERRTLKDGSVLWKARIKHGGEVVAAFLDARTSQVAAHSHRTDRDNLAALPAKLRARPIGSVCEADVLSFLTDQLKIKERSTVARMRTSQRPLHLCNAREVCGGTSREWCRATARREAEADR